MDIQLQSVQIPPTVHAQDLETKNLKDNKIDEKQREDFLDYQCDEESMSDSEVEEMNFEDLKEIDFQTNMITSKLQQKQKTEGNSDEIDFLNLWVNN